MNDFAIRPAAPEDEPFIFKAWLEGYWPHFPGNIVTPKGEFMQRWHHVIERILADPQTRTVVAHVEGKPEALLGFACGGPHCLHWAYTKQPFRRMGICREMEAELGYSYHQGNRQMSHRCRSCSPIAGYTADWSYAPELLRRYA